ncbi:MAG: T9SS type A sorting domain-containing protein, partial [Saprospiraceae bacterium]
PDPSTGDLQPPTAICRDLTVALDEAGEGSFDVEDIDNGSFDNCTPGKGLRFYVPGEEREFNCDSGNDLSATLTVTDDAGLTSTCTALITVLDILYYQHTHTREASDAAASDKLGFGLAMNNGFMVAGAPDHKVGIHHKRGAAYVFGEITDGWEGWEEIQQIVASDGAAVDYFGNSAAMDGYTMVVGAHGDNFGTITDQGSAYIYYPLGPYPSIWTQVAKISASDGAAYDYFAGSVSVTDGVVAAGAAKKKIGANTAQGAAYIFYQDAGGTDKWGQVKKLVASDGAANNFFGNSVSIGDDAELLLVGANGNASNRGAAYLFAKDQGGTDNWGQLKKLTASDPAVGDGFGVSVSLDEEYAIVGAPNKNGYRGAAYIFAQNQGGANNWGQVKKLTSPDAAANDRFGQTVVVRGQYAYVTAIRANGNAGAVYVFHRELGGPNNWGHVGTYTNGDGDSGDQFGYALAVDREYLAVSANLADMDVRDRGTDSPLGARGPVLTDAGEVCVFTGENCATRSELEDKSHAAQKQSVTARNRAASPARPLAVPPSVKCSPNPFRDELTIEIDAIGVAKLTVTDAAGRTMTSVDLPVGLGRFTLETSAFRDGMYFVQVSSESGVRVVPVALLR